MQVILHAWIQLSMMIIRIHDQEMIHFLSDCSHVFDKFKVSIDSDSIAIHTEQAKTSCDILVLDSLSAYR